MVTYETNGGEIEWVVDHELGHYMWEKVRKSTRVRFTEGIAVLFKLVQFGEDDNLIRMASDSDKEPDDWASPFSLVNPEMRMAQSFTFKVQDSDPQEVRLAVYARTNNGANFVHEFYQERGGKARAIIRVPVPEQLRDEALGIADDFPKCEMVREQAGAFQERFNITDEEAPVNYWEPHIECEGIEGQEEIKEVFEEVLQVVERGVRAA